MGVGIDFALEQLLGTADGQHGHLLAQFLAGTRGGRVDLGLCQILLAVGFGNCLVLGRFDDLVGARMGLVDDLVGLGACVLQCFVDLFLRLRQILLTAIGRSQTFSDLC